MDEAAPLLLEPNCLVGKDGNVPMMVPWELGIVSMRTLTLQRPGEADRVAVELRDDVQGLSGHHRANGGVIGIPEALE